MIMMAVPVAVIMAMIVMIMIVIMVAVRGAHVCALRADRAPGNGAIKRFVDKKKKPRAPRGNSARGFNARYWVNPR